MEPTDSKKDGATLADNARRSDAVSPTNAPQRLRRWLAETIVIVLRHLTNLLADLALVLADMGRIGILCGFSIASIAGGALIPLTSQGRELVQIHIEEPLLAFQNVMLPIAVLLWAIVGAYSALILIEFRKPTMRTRLGRWLRAATPTLLALIAPLLVAAGFLVAAFRDDSKLLALLFTGLYAVVALIAFGFEQFRRRRIAKRDVQAIEQTGNAISLKRPARARIRITPTEHLVLATYVLLLLVVPVILVVSGVEIEVAQTIGSISIYVIALSFIASLGSYVLVYLPLVMRKTSLVVPVVIFVALISLWSDKNYEVRGQEKGDAAQSDERLLLWNYIEQWTERKAGVCDENGRLPVLIVAAEGGGIRAAYWTALVLSELQQRDPQLKDRIFAISGVSGGSLGASAWVAANAEYQSRDLSDQTAAKRIRGDLESFLAQDHLSPVLGYLFFSDMVGRLICLSKRACDRSNGLEGSWERGWRNAGFSGQFEQPFLSLSLSLPILLLNGTIEESGERVIVAPVAMGQWSTTSVDYFSIGGPTHGTALSTATHLSARFPILSPLGVVYDRDLSQQLHIGDGGYYENTGTATAQEVLEALVARSDLENPKEPSSIVISPYLLSISNAPTDDVSNAANPYCETSDADQRAWILNDLTGPVRTMLQTRSAHGKYSCSRAFRWMRDRFGSSRVARISLAVSPSYPPLGWRLSQRSIDDMHGQLGAELNQEQLGSLLRSLEAKDVGISECVRRRRR